MPRFGFEATTPSTHGNPHPSILLADSLRQRAGRTTRFFRAWQTESAMRNQDLLAFLKPVQNRFSGTDSVDFLDVKGSG